MEADAKRRQDLKGRILDSLQNNFLVFESECVRRFGSDAGIFARQLLFWEGKGETPGGWIYKTQKEWTDETGLNLRPQKRARRILVGKGMIEEERRPNPRNGGRPQLYYRLNLEAISNALGISSSTGISDRSSPSGISDRFNQASTTVRTSESTTNDFSNSSVITELANTESTSKSTTESLQREAAVESALQAAEDQGSSAIGEEQTAEDGGVKRNVGVIPGHPTSATATSQVAGRSRASGGPPTRPDGLELSHIHKMLTDEKSYPKCYRVYRAYRQGKLEFEQVVDAVCFELTDGFSDAARYREVVEGIDRLLQEEERLA